MDAPNAAISAVAGGWDTQIWRVDHGGKTYALRVFRPDQRVMCGREAAVMRALSAAGLPVPRVHAASCADESGPPALLLSWCGGRTVLAEILARPWRVWSLGRALGRLHALIHAVPVTADLAAALPAWDPRREDLEPEVLARLPGPAESETCLLHLDYHPLNVMVDHGQVTGVLDWANVALGDRRADLARTVTLFRLPPLPPGTPAMLQTGMRRVLEAAWRSGYRQHARNAHFGFVDMGPFYAWAGTMMERDLRPKLGRPGVWLTENDLARIRRWTRTVAHTP